MSKEDILKDYICAKYKSVRQFTMATGLKYSTVVAILSRGLGSASIEEPTLYYDKYFYILH